MARYFKTQSCHDAMVAEAKNLSDAISINWHGYIATLTEEVPTTTAWLDYKL